MGNMRNYYKILIGNIESNRPFGISRYRCEDNIKIVVIEIVLESRILDWICVSEERDQRSSLVNMAMNIRIPYMREFLD
jgi:hypothetical protein